MTKQNINYQAMFGENVKVIRLGAGMTQEDLAEQAGITAQHLSYVESGGKAASFELVIRLASALEVSAGDLFLSHPNRPSQAGTPNELNKVLNLLKRQSKADLRRIYKILKLAGF